MGYQAESGPWRNCYLTGANELRHQPRLISESVMSAMTIDQYFDYMGLRFNAPKAEAAKLSDTTINWVITHNDADEATEFYALELLDYTLPYTRYLAQGELPAADVTVTLDRTILDQLATVTDPAQVFMDGGFKAHQGGGRALVGDNNIRPAQYPPSEFQYRHTQAGTRCN